MGLTVSTERWVVPQTPQKRRVVPRIDCQLDGPRSILAREPGPRYSTAPHWYADLLGVLGRHDEARFWELPLVSTVSSLPPLHLGALMATNTYLSVPAFCGASVVACAQADNIAPGCPQPGAGFEVGVLVISEELSGQAMELFEKRIRKGKVVHAEDLKTGVIARLSHWGRLVSSLL